MASTVGSVKSVSFGSTTTTGDEKKTKKKNNGTLGPAAAKALAAVVEHQKQQVHPKEHRVIIVKPIDRSTNQSPTPIADNK